MTNFQSVCEGDTYLIGNSSYTMPGSYTDILTSINGCDSLVNTNLTVYPISVVNNNYVICEGDIVTVGNNSYFEEGDYIDTIQTIYGCDSIINSYIQWSLPIVSLASIGTNINVSVNGGTPPFLYEIYGPSGLISTSKTIYLLYNLPLRLMVSIIFL